MLMEILSNVLYGLYVSNLVRLLYVSLILIMNIMNIMNILHYI